MPKVSIIVPIYNQEKYLQKCLDSICNQTLKDIEIICINDGSTDNSSRILQEVAKKDERIIIINQQNSGQAHARNIGINVATGDYIGFVDGDDYISPHFFEELYNTAIINNSEVCISSKIIMLDDNNKIKPKYKYCGCSSIDKQIEKLAQKSNVMLSTSVCWNKIYKNSFLKEYEINFSEYSKTFGEDILFTLLTLFFAQNISVNSSGMYYYRCFHYKFRPISFNSTSIIEVIQECTESVKYNINIQNKLEAYSILYFRAIRLFVQIFNEQNDSIKKLFNKKLKKIFNIKIPNTKPMQYLYFFIGYYSYINTVSDKNINLDVKMLPWEVITIKLLDYITFRSTFLLYDQIKTDELLDKAEGLHTFDI